MMKPSKIYKPFDVVVVPFPFSDSSQQKKRPVVVLSSEGFNSSSQHLITAMITTAKKSTWPLDTEIKDFQAVGLTISCIVRLKLYTVDQRQIIKSIGALSKKDRDSLIGNFRLAIQ